MGHPQMASTVGLKLLKPIEACCKLGGLPLTEPLMHGYTGLNGSKRVLRQG